MYSIAFGGVFISKTKIKSRKFQNYVKLSIGKKSKSIPWNLSLIIYESIIINGDFVSLSLCVRVLCSEEIYTLIATNFSGRYCYVWSYTPRSQILDLILLFDIIFYTISSFFHRHNIAIVYIWLKNYLHCCNSYILNTLLSPSL